MSLLILAPSRDGFLLVGDTHGTAPVSRDRVAGSPKTYVVGPRVAVGICGASVLDYADVARLFASATMAYDGVWSDDFFVFLDNVLPRQLTRAVESRGALQRAVELSKGEIALSGVATDGALSVFVLLASDKAPIAARYLVVPTLDGFTAERDFVRRLSDDDRAELVIVGQVEYLAAHVLAESAALLEDVRAVEERRIGDVATDEALDVVRRIHVAADMTGVPEHVIRERFARSAGPLDGSAAR